MPGDILLTGTPDGVSFARTPLEFLHSGNEIIVAVEKVGEISNRLVEAFLVPR